VRISAIKSVLVNKRLPWFVVSRIRKARNSYHYFRNKVCNYFQEESGCNKIITFRCGFHGDTGATSAIANIANLLANKYHVEFVTYPSSNFNKLLDKEVHLVNRPNKRSDLYICDIVCEHSFYEEIKRSEKKLIITCHGLLNELHGNIAPEYLKKSLEFSDKVHFVSFIQQESFQLDEGTYEVIPNTTKQVTKKIQTNNVGSVGNLDDERKNADASVKISLQSNANAIHLWSAENDSWNNEKVIVHEWESDKNKIYNSFDVLVFMSRSETFGLVVIEAMSAGLPCLLSPIPVFEQFLDCPGVVISDPNDKDTPKILDDLLKNKEQLRASIIQYFNKTYSGPAISEKWFNFISNVIDN